MAIKVDLAANLLYNLRNLYIAFVLQFQDRSLMPKIHYTRSPAASGRRGSRQLVTDLLRGRLEATEKLVK